MVQVYIRRLADLEGPLKSLKSFQRVSLRDGAKQDVEVTLPAESFECFDPMSNAMRILPGKYEILYGASSDENQLKRFVVTLQ